eukprot:354232-Chlamydomonas_euryale.AAC.10
MATSPATLPAALTSPTHADSRRWRERWVAARRGASLARADGVERRPSSGGSDAEGLLLSRPPTVKAVKAAASPATANQLPRDHACSQGAGMQQGAQHVHQARGQRGGCKVRQKLQGDSRSMGPCEDGRTSFNRGRAR